VRERERERGGGVCVYVVGITTLHYTPCFTLYHTLYTSHYTHLAISEKPSRLFRESEIQNNVHHCNCTPTGVACSVVKCDGENL
jgi:hypothetical protein